MNPLRSTMPALAAALVLGALAAVPARADILVYTADLSGAAEAPPNASPGTGFTTVTFDTSALTMQVQASFSDLLAPTTVAHIHCCTAVAGESTAGVATMVPTFAGFPAGVTSGSYDQTFDMSLAASFNPGFLTANGGTPASAFGALLAGVDEGKAYLNIHSSQFGGGEIRGFLAPIPEPQTYALMLGGLALLGAVARRRRA